MDTLASKLIETRRHVATQGQSLVARTTDACATFVDETKGASLEFWAGVGAEARRWRRFFTQRASRLQDGVRTALSIPAIERRMLVAIDGSLRAMDERVKLRLAKISKKPARRKARARKPAPRVRAAKASSPALAA